MESIFNWLKIKLSFIYKGFLFLITATIILYFFPREGKFPYEFQKGKPWQHKTYFAPFDFPIYKSQDELVAEKDTLLKDFKPYFKIDQDKQEEILNAFNRSYELQWIKSFIKDTLKSYPKIKHNLPQNDLQNFKDTCYSFLYQLIEDVYNHGIIDVNNLAEIEINQLKEINIIHNNVAEEAIFEDIPSPKEAYEKVLIDIKAFINSSDIKRYRFSNEFINQLSLNKYIESNLFFDESKTNTSHEDLINSISLTRGMVQEKSRIIIEGDIISDEDFQILESLRIEYKRKLGNTNYYLILLGQIILVFISMLVLYLFLFNFRKEILESNKDTTFILLLIALVTGVSGLVLKFEFTNVYVLPFAIIPIIILTFFDSRLALFIHFIVILLIGFYAPNGFEFIFLNFIAGIVAIFSLKNRYQRSKFFITAILVFITYCCAYFGISIIQEGNIHDVLSNYQNLGWFGGNALLILLAIPMIYLFEKTFGFLSDATLIELSDTNNPLLRKLAEVAPGTFQHSLQVANLAEEAVINIEGNPLLVRAGALYHDIGKTENAVYFTENQISGHNPHDKLEYDASSEIIVKHILDGIKIAKKYNLPKQIIDFITTHQGTAKVHYFYRLYKNNYPDKIIDLNKFAYPGPKPFSKETAVLMMADAVEAASKSLKDPTAESINELVDNIIDHQIEERQYDNATITFKDITTVKNTFKKKLLNIYHIRIKYPEENK
ncbi:HD family phosphohydrolase [Bacteroidota bacterium]